MDATLSAAHVLLSETASAFARGALSPKQIRDLETSAVGYDRSVWEKMAKLGWTSALLSGGGHDEYGGTGLLEMALIVEACGKAALPSPLFSCVVEAASVLDAAGSEQQRREWLDKIVSAEAIVTVAALEGSGEYTPDDVATSIQKASNGYQITGSKLFVRDAVGADAIIVLARAGPEPESVTWAIVPTDVGGLEIRPLPAAGSERLSEVIFHHVHVRPDALLGEPGRGWRLAREMQIRGACLKAAELVGIGQAALELTINYAKQRVQFARPIGSFQAVQHHCADMYRDLQACRLLVYQAAVAHKTDDLYSREVAIAKAKASDAIPALTRLAHQIHGSLGYYRDYPLELYYHRALAAKFAYGDAAFHKRELAKMLRENVSRFRGKNHHELPIHRL